MNAWFLDSNNATEVAYIGFWMGLVGVLGTLTGWYFTYRQAKNARKAADAAADAVENFRFRVTQYDASRDLSEAAYALDTTRRHLNNVSWRDAVDSYEDARRAIIRIDVGIDGIHEEHRQSLQKMSRQMASFCTKIDTALANKGDYPDQVKALEVIRKNYALLEIIQRSIQKDRD